MNTEVDFSDFADWQKAMARFSSSADERIAKMLEQAAADVAGDAQRLVPRGPSGRARASLRALGAAVVMGGARAPYGPWLEFGGRVGIDNSVRRAVVPGGRYIWPSWMKNRTDILTAMERGLDALADESGF